MKLYPLLYTNEAARTATEAIDKDVAAITSDDYADWEMESPVDHSIILISTNRAMSIMKSLPKKGWSPEEISAAESHNFGKLIASRAVVGFIQYSDSDENLWKIDASSGVASFGPLAYQLVMWQTGGWLESDTSLKPASERVWQKMYELSNLYERKWLGEWGKEHLLDRMTVGAAGTDLREYYNKIENGEADYEDEQAFLSWLQEHNLKPETYGWLWAYQAVSHDSNTRNLYEKGKQLIKDLMEIYPQFTEEDLFRLFSNTAGPAFFSRLYRSKASY